MSEGEDMRTAGSPRRRESIAGSPGADNGAATEVLSPRGEPFAVIGRAGPVERRGAPPIPAEAREELLVLKDGELVLCTRPDGDLAPARASGEGLYAHDTRHLSELRLEVGGARPVALSYTALEDRAVLDATNAALRGDAHPPVPQLSLSITRELTIAAGRLYLTIRVRNFLGKPVATSVTLALAADFADMFEVRGSPRRTTRGHALAPRPTERGLTLAYMGEDTAFRETVVEFEPRPAHLELAPDGGLAGWEVVLEPGVSTELLTTFEPSIGGRRRPRRRLATAAGELREAETRWRSRCTTIETDHQRFNDVITRSAQDLRALSMPAPGGRILAAGIPWYVAPFGRDALISAGEALILNPDLTGDALAVLAKLQATKDDPWRDAEPGKILHELRVGELAGAGLVPHTPYYGTVDATPLLLMRAADLYAWTGDLEAMRALRPALDRALAWIDRYGDRDGDGFVEYDRRSDGGLRNQGWKDSGDSIVHADGTLAEGPIALVEVQGYVYAAKRKIADVYDALDQPDVA
ncbi:MAG: amylo-alpha-1,6-glucosidase, partial [Solirubrobacteraceae bacterium]